MNSRGIYARNLCSFLRFDKFIIDKETKRLRVLDTVGCFELYFELRHSESGDIKSILDAEVSGVWGFI